MHHFEYQNGELYAEDIAVQELVREFGTPLYVYSAATFRRHFQAFDSAFQGIGHLTCFSVKANSNTGVLKLLGNMGAGMDIVSGGELYRALAAGIPSERIVYSGVGKSSDEIEQALEADILLFNVESMQELSAINDIAGKMNKTARISFRINPDVDPKTHPYISTGMEKNKFGLNIEQSLEAYKKAKDFSNIDPIGIDCHIGSQLTDIDPFLEALDKILNFSNELEKLGIHIQYLDLGGGLGIKYNDEEPPHPEKFGEALLQALKGKDLKLILEPGRVIAGNAGILVTKVVYTKETPSKNFAIVDAAMNDLMRPALYQSFHRIIEVHPKQRTPITMDIVGPICESSDFLARDRALPRVEQNEYLAVMSAGAYGFTMSSQYNSRPRAAEVLVDGKKAVVVRKRESYEDLIRLEKEGLESIR